MTDWEEIAKEYYGSNTRGFNPAEIALCTDIAKLRAENAEMKSGRYERGPVWDQLVASQEEIARLRAENQRLDLQGDLINRAKNDLRADRDDAINAESIAKGTIEVLERNAERSFKREETLRAEVEKLSDRLAVASADNQVLKRKLKSSTDMNEEWMQAHRRLSSELLAAQKQVLGLRDALGLIESNPSTSAMTKIFCRQAISSAPAPQVPDQVASLTAQVLRLRAALDECRDVLFKIGCPNTKIESYEDELPACSKEHLVKIILTDMNRARHVWGNWGGKHNSKIQEQALDAPAPDLSFVRTLVEALESISKDYYNRYGGLSIWKREALEQTLENDTTIAKEALAATKADRERWGL